MNLFRVAVVDILKLQDVINCLINENVIWNVIVVVWVFKKRKQCARKLDNKNKSLKMSHINVEIKAKCANAEKIKKILKDSNADFKGFFYKNVKF